MSKDFLYSSKFQSVHTFTLPNIIVYILHLHCEFIIHSDLHSVNALDV